MSQAVNAVLLLVLLPFMRALGCDERVMGPQKLGATGRALTGVALVGIAVSILALALLVVI